jgi:hypothetical protein
VKEKQNIVEAAVMVSLKTAALLWGGALRCGGFAGRLPGCRTA